MYLLNIMFYFDIFNECPNVDKHEDLILEIKKLLHENLLKNELQSNNKSPSIPSIPTDP